MKDEKAKQIIKDAEFEPEVSMAIGTVLDITENLRKAFALSCRFISDEMDCPAAMMETDWIECNGESGQCGDHDKWECWQKYFSEKVDSEQICRKF